MTTTDLVSPQGVYQVSLNPQPVQYTDTLPAANQWTDAPPKYEELTDVLTHNQQNAWHVNNRWRSEILLGCLFNFTFQSVTNDIWRPKFTASLKYRMLIVFHVIIDLTTFWHRCINLIHWYAAKIFYQSSFPYLSYLYIFFNISVHLVNFLVLHRYFKSFAAWL